MKVCAARKCQYWVCLQISQLQCPMGCCGHHAMLCNPKGLFSETVRIFGIHWSHSMNNCPCVQGKSIKPPPPPEVCVWGGGQGYYSMILPLFLLS